MKLYANPYDTSKVGFYFESASEFESKAKLLNCEEFEINFIDSDTIDYKLFEKLGCNQGNLDEIFGLVDELESLDQEQLTAFEFLLDTCQPKNFDSVKELLGRIDEVCITSESLSDYAYDLMKDCYDIPEYLQQYIDYEKFGRDLLIEGSVVKLNGYLITNANDF